jgi:hypothetical protein
VFRETVIFTKKTDLREMAQFNETGQKDIQYDIYLYDTVSGRHHCCLMTAYRHAYSSSRVLPATVIIAFSLVLPDIILTAFSTVLLAKS